MCSFSSLRYNSNCEAIQRLIRCYSYTHIQNKLSLAAEISVGLEIAFHEAQAKDAFVSDGVGPGSDGWG